MLEAFTKTWHPIIEYSMLIKKKSEVSGSPQGSGLSDRKGGAKKRNRKKSQENTIIRKVVIRESKKLFVILVSVSEVCKRLSLNEKIHAILLLKGIEIIGCSLEGRWGYDLEIFRESVQVDVESVEWDWAQIDSIGERAEQCNVLMTPAEFHEGGETMHGYPVFSIHLISRLGYPLFLSHFWVKWEKRRVFSDSHTQHHSRTYILLKTQKLAWLN